MNLALSTLVLFLLLAPGIFFRKLYYSEEFSKQYFKESLFTVFISAILPSMIFQVIWFFLAKWFTRYEVDLKVLVDFLSTSPKLATIDNIETNTYPILIYQASMLSVAALSGYLFRKVIRFKNWDRKYKLFRFQNHWHYILNGEFYDFPRANISLKEHEVRDIEFVFVDALMETNDGTFLYDGILVDYELSRDGGLDSISLTEAQRRKLADDRGHREEGNQDENDPYYSIEGHILVLKYSEIKNLNLSYYVLESGGVGRLYPRKAM